MYIVRYFTIHTSIFSLRNVCLIGSKSIVNYFTIEMLLEWTIWSNLHSGYRVAGVLSIAIPKEIDFLYWWSRFRNAVRIAQDQPMHDLVD